MGVCSPSRDRSDPCPTVTAYAGKQREKEHFDYAFISKLDRPWAAGQFLCHACNPMPKLSFFFSLGSLTLSLWLVGVDPWPVLSPNNVLASGGVVVAGTGQNYARVHMSSGGDLEPELWDLLFCCHT